MLKEAEDNVRRSEKEWGVKELREKEIKEVKRLEMGGRGEGGL